MAYIGKAPGFGIRNRYYYTATASQTLFSGADDNGQTLAYADSKYIDVYLNGVSLVAGTDYTATTLTSITLTSGAAADDIIEIVAYDIFSVADTVSASNGGTFSGEVTFDGTTNFNGTVNGIDVYDAATSSTGFFSLPSGTTAQRPVSPANGYVRFNTDDNVVEEYRSGAWQTLSNLFSASGGTETTETIGGVDYKIHTFTSSGSFSVFSGSKNVEYLIVGGGGGGGAGWTSTTAGSGAGGAGGYRSSIGSESSGGGGSTESTFVAQSTTYSVVVGAGGAFDVNGVDSSFGTITSIGGGSAGYSGNRTTYNGDSGGSGGGTVVGSGSPGSGTANQGFDGGSGGSTNNGTGGGGAGAAGSGVQGGVGVQSSANGTATYYGGGGSGGSSSNTAGGSGGGGTGGPSHTAGAPNTGGGGGGGYGTGGSAQIGSAGGSGIVIIRYPI